MSRETAAIICRVSTREQEDGYSLDAQENLLKGFSASQRFEVSLVYRFSETASKHAQRAKFRAFMEEVGRLKIRHIVVEKVDRLSRSGLREAVMIDDWLEADETRHLHCVKDGIDLHKFARSGDKLNWGMRVVLAKNYTDNLKEEIRKSVDAMLRKGIWPAKTPKGYIRDKSHPVCPIQPDPVRAPLIRQLFDLYDTGDWSMRRLEDKLFELGYRTSRGAKLQVNQIHGILHDPFYMGKMLFEGKLWEGAHPPLISAEQFYRVQKRLTREGHDAGAAPFQRHSHTYRRLVFCGGCGKALTWEIQKGRSYGYCKGYKTCPERASIREDALEINLIPYLDAFRLQVPGLAQWLKRALKAMNADEQFRREESREELEKLLSRVDQRLSRVLDMRIDESISEGDFTRKRTELTQEKDLLLERLGRLAEGQEAFLDNVATLIELTQDLALRFASFSGEKKRSVIQRIFQRITVIGTNGKTGSRIEIEHTDLFSKLLGAIESIQTIKSSKNLILEENKKSDFEPLKMVSGKDKSDNSHSSYSFWWPEQNKFRTFLITSHVWREFFILLSTISPDDWRQLLSGLSECYFSDATLVATDRMWEHHLSVVSKVPATPDRTQPMQQQALQPLPDSLRNHTPVQGWIETQARAPGEGAQIYVHP